jgi:hypothetical protein
MPVRQIHVRFFKKRFMAFAVFYIVLSVTTVAFAGGNGNVLFIDVPVSADLSTMEDQAKVDPTIVRSRHVHVSFDNLAGKDFSEGASDIALNLFYDVYFTAVKDRMESRSENRYTWFGHIEGAEYSQVTLVVEDGTMAGNIRVDGRMFQVRYIGDGVHAIYEIDQSAFPEELPPVPVQIPYNFDLAPQTANDDGKIIEVMVVYTADAVVGSPGIDAEIQLAFDETNLSYVNSGITQRVRLVHSSQVSYTETGDMKTDLNRLRDTSDGFMDNVHTLRETYAADLVSLWVENGNYCGVAYKMSTVNSGFKYWAFSVVARSCATGIFAFGHELGHNMGADHDWYVDDSIIPYTYSHGYVDLTNRWRTIMAYYNKCTDSGFFCPLIPYWSNPDVSFGGAPTGVPEGTDTSCTAGNLGNPDCDADNRKTLNNTAFTVANFRASVTGGSDDAIFDFGASGIWVRYNDSTWSKLHSVSPELIAIGDMDGNGKDEVILDFGSSGIWVRYDNSSWSKLHSASPELIATSTL